MKILFLGIGKTKHKYLTEGIERYKKLIGPYASVEEIYLKEEDEKPDPVNAESGKLEKNMPKNYYSVLLDVEGKMISSEELSKIIKNKRDSSVPGIVFLIGGSNGVSEKLKKECDAKISFSRLTFTHQMIRLILSEQLYRSFSIIANKKYHK